MGASFTPLTFPERIATVLREDGWSIAITGASGWMGQALLEMLEPVFPHHYHTHVAAFGSSARTLTLRSGREITLRPTAELASLPPGKWIVVHAAYGTKDRVSLQGNDAFVSANEDLTEIVTQSIRKLKPRAILFPSSGAVYDKNGGLSTDIDTNPYGVLKRRDEEHFTALAAEVAARIVIPRVYNMSGPYINKWSAYALSDLIVQLLDGKLLTIQSPGPVVRSYTHVRDILTLVFYCLLDDQSWGGALTFDTRGVDVELAELAQMIETTMLGEIRSTLRIADQSAPGSTYIGKPEPMRTLCAQYRLTLIDLPTQIVQTAEDIAHRR